MESGCVVVGRVKILYVHLSVGIREPQPETGLDSGHISALLASDCTFCYLSVNLPYLTVGPLLTYHCKSPSSGAIVLVLH